MDIKLLDKAAYAGRKFTARYQTAGYYDIRPSGQGFQLAYVPFDAPEERSFDDTFYGDWLEDPIAYGAFEGERLIGFVEGSMETWNNRFRISNICVFEDAARGSGVGTRLMAAIQQEAATRRARMIILETQTCNENAISFYKKNGFDIIGFDLYSYSNTDPERHEVRIDTILFLNIFKKAEERVIMKTVMRNETFPNNRSGI